MRPAARLPRRFRVGWRDLDRPFLGWVVLSLIAHGAMAAAVPRAPRGPAVGAQVPLVVGLVMTAPPLPPPLPRSAQGVHEIVASPAGDGPAVGDLLASGGIDTDLTAVLSVVEGVRLPRPGERLAFRPSPERDPGYGCGVDESGGRFCKCFRSRSRPR